MNRRKQSFRQGHEPTARVVAPSGEVQVWEANSKSSVGQSTTFCTGGFAVQHRHMNTQEGYTFNWQGDPHYLALHDMSTKDGETFADDLRVAGARNLSGRLTFVPAGCRAWGWAVPARRSHSFTALFFDLGQMEDELATRMQQRSQ